MNTQNAKQMRLTRFLVVSVLIHLVLAALLYYAPRLALMQELAHRLDHKVVDKTEDVVTQIELIEQEDLQKQVVQQSDQSINEQAPKTEDYYLSKNNQSVKKQTKAPLTGKFNNTARPGTMSQPQKAQDMAQKSKEQKPDESQEKSRVQKLGLQGLSLDETMKKTLKGVSSKAQQKQQASAGAFGNGVNQSDDYLEKIETGAQTLLNTKEFIYYSYFMRVKEQLRSHWSPRIRRNVEFLFSKNQRGLASIDKKATSLRVTLDKDGYLEKIELLHTSGFKEIDVAAIEAFRAAAPFLNPPQGVAEKDGSIRIVWDFILET